MEKVYIVKEYSYEKGVGEVRVICDSPESVVSYLTHDGHRKGRLTDGHDIYVKEGIDICSMIWDNTILKFTPDEIDDKDSIYALLGLEKNNDPEYYIIHVYDVFSSKFFKK